MLEQVVAEGIQLVIKITKVKCAYRSRHVTLAMTSFQSCSPSSRRKFSKGVDIFRMTNQGRFRKGWSAGVLGSTAHWTTSGHGRAKGKMVQLHS
jgi:hypothetical protein